MRDWPLNIVSPRWRRAVFLDRDGTINVDTHYPHNTSDLQFEHKAIDGLRVLSRLPLDVIVISNQAGLALGYFTRQQMSDFNSSLRFRVGSAGARIDAFYYCPHLEPKDLDSDQLPCPCSKPAPGMLLEAARDFKIDCSKSFLIGDKSSDIAAGKAVGCITILVQTGKAGLEASASVVEPSQVVADLEHAARIIERYLESESHQNSQQAAR